MNSVGSWKITVSTPMGPQEMQLRIDSQHDGFVGRIESPMGKFDVTGTVTGNTLCWDMKATKPMPITVTFNVQIDGDTLSGTAKLGIFGKSTVTGVRLTTDLNMDRGSADTPESAGLITGDSVDPRYNQPFIDVNELRSAPAPHRYVHGGFKGTDAQFSFYFPPAENYRGRFFHNTYPMATTSDVGPFPIQFDVAVGDLGFTFDSGAYYIQTNLGGADRAPPADPAIAAYQVNAEAAKYSRIVATELYGKHRPYGYLFGGSGGSYQVMGAAENTEGVWDGFLPYVLGAPNAIPSMFTIRMHVLRVLKRRNKFPAVMDAINPGGSGDPYAELNEEERAALREAALLGYPMRGWWNHQTLTSGYFYNVAPLVPMLDPTYLDDFWSKPGYLGSDPSVRAARFRFDTTIAGVTVAKVTDRHSKHVILAAVPEQEFADAHLVILSGASAGKSVSIGTIDGKALGFAFATDPSVINGIQPGDRVRIDNGWTLALQTYQRHQVPATTDLYGWNQYRGADGKPIYPQRDILIGPIGAGNTAGRIPEGHVRGKVLVLQALMDIDALPWQADWYRSKVRQALGPDFERNFALWFIDNAQHENPLNAAARANTVSFAGALQQGLRDLSAWVETGRRPPDTQYEVIDTQVKVPTSASARKGIQPVVELKANGGLRTDVAVNEPVNFSATIEVPANAGKVVAAEWDFEGTGNYAAAEAVETPQALIQLSAVHSYSTPGTYFPVLRAASHREGDTGTPYCRVQNLSRARVVVK